MQLYWEAFGELMTTTEVLKQDLNPVYYYDDQSVDGAIIDIGCGQTSPLIKYASTPGRKLIGIDNEGFQLKKLRSRMIVIAGQDSDEWELITCDMRLDPLPDETYAIVILWNILHFFSLMEYGELVKRLKQQIVSGSLISICVHSVKFYMNAPANPDNNEYFAHYFTQSDLDQLLPPQTFDKLYSADIERKYSRKDDEVKILWGEKIIKRHEDFQSPGQSRYSPTVQRR